MNENQDLLDLCRLNQMEPQVKESSAYDKDNTLKAIDFKRRQLVNKIHCPKLSDEVMQRHLDEQVKEQ